MVESVIGIVVICALIFLLTALFGAPYVPTQRKQIESVFSKLRPFKKNDVLVDLGSGDGVVLYEAIRAGASKVIGYEINPILVLISWLRLRSNRGRFTIFWRSFWRINAPSDVSIVYTFGESRDIKKMYDLVQKWSNQSGREIDFISYGFEVPGFNYSKKENAHFLYNIAPLHSQKT